jgi:hypothetical protein
MRSGRKTSALAHFLVPGVLVLAPAPAAAQIEFSGQVDLLAMVGRDSLDLNANFRQDNPFHPVRVRLFARSWVTENIGVFTEFLYDVDASPRINGAYAVINELAGQPWLNSRLGLAPSLIGSFSLRGTYFNSNPLVGVPLLWHFRTNLDGEGTSTAAQLLASGGEPGIGVPFLYDGCWNIQWELFGEFGIFQYSVGITPGSISNPVKSRFVSGSQVLARVGVAPFSGFRIGVSGGHGPYLSEPVPGSDGQLPYAADPGDYDQSVIGVDLEYANGGWLFFSEVFAGRWETPLVTDALEAIAGYVEGRFDFLPGWYVAGRAGGMVFGDISSPTGDRAAWDNTTYRTEFALGYRVSRQVLAKADWQRTMFDGAFPAQNHFALQLTTAF